MKHLWMICIVLNKIQVVVGQRGTNYEEDIAKIKMNSQLPHVSESKTVDAAKLNLLSPDGSKVKKDFILFHSRDGNAEELDKHKDS